MIRPRWILASVVVLLVLLSVALQRDLQADDAADAVLEDHECLACHGFPDNEDGAPYVDGHGFLGTVHAKGDVACVACHENHEDYPHPKDGTVLTMQCGECHDDAHEALAGGPHAGLLGDSAEDADTTAACATCHSPHTLQPDCAACHEDVWDDLTHCVHMAVLGEAEDDPTDPSACVACHGGHETGFGCGDCHEDVYEKLQGSVHGPLLGEPNSRQTAEACIVCHGSPHGISPMSDRDAPLHPFNVPKTCGACHFDQEGVDDLTEDQILAERFMDDTHGHALVRAGLLGAPTCVSCHGGHGILASEDPLSEVHPQNVSESCGKCHLGILEHYRESVHGQKRLEHATNAEGQEAATCTDCHQPHGVETPGTHFKLGIIETCAGCHQEYAKTYKGTYHGRVSKIGFGGVASCDECHTAHDIHPSSDPRSALHADHRTATCARCHEGATDSFSSYLVHANPLDEEGFPVLYWARRLMRGLVFFTWAIWGLHTILWLIRALLERKKIKAHLKPVSGRWYRRWPWSYRAIHLTLIFSFLLLALTGIPLRFPDAGWSTTIFTILGGPDSARFLHRVGAGLTFTYAAAFLAMIAVRFFKGEKGLFWGPNTLLPQMKDLTDMKANVRWFFKGGEPPHFDRWTYFEKFDFIAEAWGVFFIGITGLVMWFPMFFTSFLPGPVINLAHILHSYEALLATTFIFSMHFFNANLRPGKFPLDPMFLTGRISEEELKHERPAEYERMRASGRLETEVLPPPNERLVRRAYRIGGVLLSVGLLLLALMLYAILRHGID